MVEGRTGCLAEAHSTAVGPVGLVYVRGLFMKRGIVVLEDWRRSVRYMTGRMWKV